MRPATSSAPAPAASTAAARRRFPTLAVVAALGAALLFASAGCGAGVVTQALPIGASCAANSDCGSSPTFYCESALPNGYCKKDCRSDLDCPTEAVCVGASGLTTGSCYAICPAGGTCARKGYTCLPASTTPPLTASRNYCDVATGG